MTKQEEVWKGVFRPDLNGKSRYVWMTEIWAADRGFTRGNGVGPFAEGRSLGRYYVIERTPFGRLPVKERRECLKAFHKAGEPDPKPNTVVRVRTTGVYNGNKNPHYIPPCVRKELKGKPCVVTGETGDKVQIDHKPGRDIMEISKDPEDYQNLLRSLNDIKREYCTKVCVGTGMRFPGSRAGFSENFTSGGPMYDPHHGRHGCEGCYYHDIADFHSHFKFEPRSKDQPLVSNPILVASEKAAGSS